MKLLILSDIHANWPALRAVLEAETGVDEILCLGDLVDYGPQPVECVQWAIEHVAPARMVQGNHDWGVAWNEDPHCSPPYRFLTAVTQKFSVAALGEGLRSFLSELMPIRTFQVGKSTCVACHAAPSEPLFRYLRINGANGQLEGEVAKAGNPDFLFFGHTHWTAKVRCGGTLVVNPGSVGQPKDGDPRAAYAVWEDGEVSLRRAAYDVEETVRAYGDTPLDSKTITALAEVLRTGGDLPKNSGL